MIDLHIHSNHSDGDYDELTTLQMMEKSNITLGAISDHDSVMAYVKMKENKIDIKNYFTGKLITGCEIKAVFDGISIEILGYGVDIEQMTKVLEKINKISKEKQFEIFEYLKKVARQLGLKYDEKYQLEYGQYAGAHFWKAINPYFEINQKLIEPELINTMHSFFRKCYSNPNSPFYIDDSTFVPTAKEVNAYIKKFGGISIVAHPGIYDVENQCQFLEKIFHETNVDGAECFYSLYDEKMQNQLIETCLKHHKYISGGSDFHGPLLKPEIKLGILKIDEKYFDWTNQIKPFQI